jgi:hypothetical protein
MANRSKKNRLKNKFSGIEVALKVKEVKNTIETQSDDSNQIENAAEVNEVIAKQVSNDLSYLDFVIKLSRIGYNLAASAIGVLSKYIFRPIIKDSQRIISLLKPKKDTSAIIDASKNTEVEISSKVIKQLSEEFQDEIQEPIKAAVVKTQKMDLRSIEAISVNVNNEKQAEEKKSVAQVDQKRVLTTFELDLNQVFHKQKIELVLNGENESIEASDGTLEFDATIYEFIAFRLDQTNLNQNIAKIDIKVNFTEKEISHSISFNLKESGQKWAHIFAKNVLSSIHKRISPYAGSIDCTHVFNATTKNEYCTIFFSHQRLDAYTNKAQNESVKKVVSQTAKKENRRELSL